MTQAQPRRFFLTHTHWIVGSAFIIIAIAFGGFAVGTVKYISEIKEKLTYQMTENAQHIDHLKAGISQDNVRRRNIIATEKLIASMNKKLKYDARIEYATYFVDAVEKMPGVTLPLALAVATAESNFNPKAESYIVIGGVQKVNAVGMFQIVSQTGEFIAAKMGIPYSDANRYDARLNIRMGVWYLQYLLNRYDGDIEQALAYFMDGNASAVGWGARRKYNNTDEYNKMSIESITAELDNLTKETKDDSLRARVLNAYLSAKTIPPQTLRGTPKIIGYMHDYIEYFRKADVYFTPSNNGVIDTTERKK